MKKGVLVFVLLMTVIIVAHRHETLKYCNEIYKLEKGMIYGPYQEIVSS